MRFKNLTSLLILMLIASFIFGSSVMAVEAGKYTDSNIPDSWYKTPKTASEMGIKEFDQSPMLDDEVASGELPPVKERLPEDPPVIEPYSEIGEYGGTLNVWHSALNLDAGTVNHLSTYIKAGMATPDTKKRVPYLVSGWEYSDNYKNLTLHLRKGLKWSDGQELTSEDFLYWWEHVANNKGLNPTPPEDWDPGLLKVTVEDKYTVTFHYDRASPRLHEFTFQWHIIPYQHN